MKDVLIDGFKRKPPVTTLLSASISPEVKKALTDWIKHTQPNERGVLIGGLALSFYATPRYTEDVDVLFLNEADIPKIVDGFKRNRKSSFENKSTGVEIELVTRGLVAMPQHIIERVYKTAVEHDGIKVASLEGLIVLKLYGALNPKRQHRDLGDIERILEHNKKPDLTEWNLPESALELYINHLH